jgi:hypothetical protein
MKSDDYLDNNVAPLVDFYIADGTEIFQDDNDDITVPMLFNLGSVNMNNHSTT